MPSLVCFTHNDLLATSIASELQYAGYCLQKLPIAPLSDHVRAVIQQHKPKLIFIEVTGSLDIISLYVFLRTDASTRDSRIIFLSQDPLIHQYAYTFGADASLRTPLISEHFWTVVQSMLPGAERSVGEPLLLTEPERKADHFLRSPRHQQPVGASL